MKKIAFFLLLSLILFANVPGNADGLWTKYVAADGSYSFHYPTGWQVKTYESMVAVENARTDEELLMTMIPFDPRKTPADLAAGFIAMLRSGSPNLRAANWRTEPKTKDSQVIFDIMDNNNGKQYNGLGIVIKSEQQATWFSYAGPAAGYSQTRGSTLLQGFMGSLASGSASKMPAVDYNLDFSTRINRNADAFMFVLEFALGAPLTKFQEDLILDELKNGWRTLSEAELQKYDQYPSLVQSILKMGQKDLETLRAALDKSIREWLNEAAPSDKAVRVIRDQLQKRGRTVIAGEPPLTEMSLTAYSEIIAFSRLLRNNSQAMPEHIAQSSVQEIKRDVVNVWRSFPKNDQQAIATTPGLWICMRVLLRNGSQAEQDKIRTLIKKLDTATRDIGTAPAIQPGKSGTNRPMDMTSHWCLMQMQQQTFNTYMWSRGFNYQPATGRMW